MEQTPLKQRPAREQQAAGVSIPYWHEDLDAVITYHLKLLLLTPEELDRLVLYCRKHAALTKPNPNDNREGHLDYEPTDKERHSVLRHCCINRTERTAHVIAGYAASYDNILHRIATKGVDVVARQMQLRRHICALIDAHYPHLALESAYYLWRYEVKLGLEAGQ